MNPYNICLLGKSEKRKENFEELNDKNFKNNAAAGCWKLFGEVKEL